jgi:hypothetical protein
MRRVIYIVVFCFCFALAGIAAAEQIDNWRCGSAMVSLGQSKYKVESTCGKPSATEDTSGGSGYTENWTYNMGMSDYVYKLHFTSGTLDEIKRAGRGYYR